VTHPVADARRPVVVGLDIGGSTVTTLVADLDGTILVATDSPALDWSASPVDRAVAWMARRIAAAVPAGCRVAAVGVGAQGCDSNEHRRGLEAAASAAGFRATVVNDAALLLPAAQLATGIAVIAGTGAIAVGLAQDGSYLFAGGWGWVLGDDAGAVGLVREATRAVLWAHDEGTPDDGLLAALLETFSVPDAAALARTVNDEPTPEHWGPRAPAVFAAADAGSALAVAVIDRGAQHLIGLIGQLRGRGAVGRDVVVAGSVIVKQTRLLSAFRAQLASAQPDLAIHVLVDPPAMGAVALARALASEV
jgi:N-acetylglucosamine kinase-like BadF-type ATPase